ncbi:MAG: T9SS type A sorting domain-containing protein [Paludibacter sp.]|nr:T9SS type A sorting domain-containing protein [Paludibacter sp.]
MKKITFLLFAFLLANFVTYATDINVVGSFNGWNNADSEYTMTANGNDIYTLQKTLAAGDYTFKVVYYNTWDGPDDGSNRKFTLTEETTVTFYAKENGSNILFFCDAQELYIAGACLGADGWNNPVAMTMSSTDATYTADMVSGEYKIISYGESGTIWSDITPNNLNIDATGNFTIKLDFATFAISSSANGETTPTLNGIGNSYIFVGDDVATATWYNGSASYQSENFNSHDFGSVTSPIYIGGEAITTPVATGVTTKLGYQIDNLGLNEVVLPYDSDNGTESTKWKSTTTVNAFSGYTLTRGQAYSLNVWFYATDGTSTFYDSNNSANYVATFTYDISTNNNQPITSSTHITLKNQTIYATFEGSTQIALYSMNGQLIDSRLVHENYSMQLAKGMYMLKINNEKVQKIVVR